jgi:hypothetical protein
MTSKVKIGNGFSVDGETLEKYWNHISDRLSAKKYREVTEIQTLERQRQELHNDLVKSGGFDPELRYKSDEEQRKSGFWDFNESLEDYIAHRLAKEGGIEALNRRVLGMS